MVLTTGTVMAQAIGYLITPILTRIYSNKEMDDLGVYMRSVFSGYGCLADAQRSSFADLEHSDYSEQTKRVFSIRTDQHSYTDHWIRCFTVLPWDE